uniref:Putative secreted protein n=1 Tax=Ixodes ricinus TaxID=34613 RepID=A0A147BFF0_IXORI
MTQNIGAFMPRPPCALILKMVTLASSITLGLAKTENASNIKEGTLNKYGTHFLRYEASFMIAPTSQARIPWTIACLFARKVIKVERTDISTGSTWITINAK